MGREQIPQEKEMSGTGVQDVKCTMNQKVEKKSYSTESQMTWNTGKNDYF